MFKLFVLAAVLALAAAKPSPQALVYTAPAIAPIAPAYTAPISYSPLAYSASYKPLASYAYNVPYAYNYGYDYRLPYAGYSSYIAA